MNSLPNELVSLILRNATRDDDSLQSTFKDPCVLATYRFTETDRSYAPMQTKLTLSRVCKRLSSLIRPYLYEYIYAHPSSIPQLSESLRIHDTARFVKRADVQLSNFEHDWEYGWCDILLSCKNLRILDLYESLECPPSDWTAQIYFTLSNLDHLTRIEWNGPNADISDLHHLSILCPKTQHLGMTLNAPLATSEAHNDAFAIKFPCLKVLLLNWVQPDLVPVLYPQFTNWTTPQLGHLTYFIGGRAHYGLVEGLMENGWGRTITSLELPVLGKNGAFWFNPAVLQGMPKLHTLVLDVFKTFLPPCILYPLPFASTTTAHTSLTTLGWRLRIGSALQDITQLQAHRWHFALVPCHTIYFPNLAQVKVVHPYPFDEYYADTLTPLLVECWKELLQDEEWVRVVDFEGGDLSEYFLGDVNTDAADVDVIEKQGQLGDYSSKY